MVKVVEGPGTNPLDVSLKPAKAPAQAVTTDNQPTLSGMIESRTFRAMCAGERVTALQDSLPRGQAEALKISGLRQMDPELLRPLLPQLREIYDSTSLVRVQEALLGLMSKVAAPEDKPGLWKKALQALEHGLSPMQEAGLKVLQDHPSLQFAQRVFDYLRSPSIKPRLRILGQNVAQCILQQGSPAVA